MGNQRGSDNVWQWLMETGEEKVAQVAGEMLQNERVTEFLSVAIQRAAETKGQVDRSLENLLAALNVVSRADHERLVAKVEALQGSLVNINIKLDRILAEQEAKKKPAPRRAAKATKADGAESAG